MADQPLQQSDQNQSGIPPEMQSAMGLMPLFGGQPQQPAPMAAPPQPPVTGGPVAAQPDLLTEAAESEKFGRQTFGESVKRQRQLSDQIADLMTQQEQTGKNLSFHPDFHGSFLHNLGQALLTVGAASGPGQAVQNVAYSGPRQEYEARAERISGLQKQLEPEEKLGAAAAGMSSRAIMGGARVESAQAAQTRADAEAQKVANQYQIDLERNAQGWDKLTLQQQQLQAKEWYQKAYIDAFNARTAAGMAQTEARVAAQRDIAAVVSQSAVVKEHPWLTQLIPGLMEAPAPGAAAPIAPPKPNQPAKPKADAAAPARPSNVPPDYVYKKNGPKGTGWYRPGKG